MLEGVRFDWTIEEDTCIYKGVGIYPNEVRISNPAGRNIRSPASRYELIHKGTRGRNVYNGWNQV